MDITLEDLGGLSVTDTTDTATSSNSGRQGTTSSTEDKALQLLGSGVNAEAVAAALGVQPSRISQLLAEEVFARKVAALRYTNLQKHTVRDNKYDELEDSLLAKLKTALPLMVKPRDIIDGLTKVNGAKRRGSSNKQQVHNQQNIVTLVLPTVIQEKFAVNIDNQVIKAGDQNLLTMPSGNLLKQVEVAAAAKAEELSHDSTHTNNSGDPS